MKSRTAFAFAFAFAFVFVTATPALADWGVPAGTKVCADMYDWDKDTCKAEIEKRATACLADAAMQADLTAVGWTAAAPNDAGKALCQKAARKEIMKQLASLSRDDEGVARRKKAEAEAAAAKEKAEAEALQKREVPKAAGHNPAIEKMITSTFVKRYPEKKFLKIVLDGKTNWEISRSGLGIITKRSAWATIISKKGDKCELYGTYWEQPHNGKGFAGELEEHSEGAEEFHEILCNKVK